VRRILVPLGLAPLGEAKLPVAESLARAYGAELILLHVLRRASHDAAGVSPEEARARAYLDTVAAPLHTAGVQAHGVVRVDDDVAAAIVDEAREQDAGLIVLGADVRRGLPRALRGSVAEAVTRLSPVPVTLVRPEVEAGTAPPVRSFDADAARRGPLASWMLGLRTVEVARIVGSVGRAAELDASFRSADRSRTEQQRYARVRRGVRTDAALPPAQLYKLDAAYYVLDGHHRVAAAKELGQLELEAEVTELVPLDDAEAQRSFAARRRFEHATGLTRIIAAHAPDTWARLGEMVERFTAEAGLPDRRQAAQRWYARVYRPLAALVRQRGLRRRFPGAHSSDLVAMIDRFRECKRRQHGQDLGWKEAADLFARRQAQAA
jgi:nucleotide-binding universal stress UspA family protein